MTVGTLVIQEERLLGGADVNGGVGMGDGNGGVPTITSTGGAAAAVALLDLEGMVSEFNLFGPNTITEDPNARGSGA